MKIVAQLEINWQGPNVTKRVERAISRRVQRAGVFLQRRVVDEISQPSRIRKTKLSAGAPPGADTGELKRSILTTMVDPMTAVVFSNSKQGLIFELGGTIRPRSKRALAIPLTKKARRWRGPTRNFKPNGQDLVPIRRPGLPTLLVEKFGKRGGALRTKWTIHFILVDIVRMPRHPFLSTALSKNRDEIILMIGEPLSDRELS